MGPGGHLVPKTPPTASGSTEGFTTLRGPSGGTWFTANYQTQLSDRLAFGECPISVHDSSSGVAKDA